MTTDDPIVAGLLREHDGYLRTGQTERAKLVADQLELRGYGPDGAKLDAKAAEPKGRQAPSKRTTAGKE